MVHTLKIRAGLMGLALSWTWPATAAAKPAVPPAALEVIAQRHPHEGVEVRQALTVDLDGDGRQDTVLLVLLHRPVDATAEPPLYDDERILVFFGNARQAFEAPIESGDLAFERRGWTELTVDGACLVYQHYNNGSATEHSLQRFHFCARGQQLRLRLLETGIDDADENAPREATVTLDLSTGQLSHHRSRSGKAKDMQARFKAPVIPLEGFVWDGYRERFPEAIRHLIP